MGHLPMGTGHLPIPVPSPDRPHRFHDKLCRNAPQNAVGKPPFGTVCARLSGVRSSSGRTSGPCGRSGRPKTLGASRPRKGPSGRTQESESRKPAAAPRRPCLEPRALHSISRAFGLRGRLLQALRHHGRQGPGADFQHPGQTAATTARVNTRSRKHPRRRQQLGL